MVRLPDDPMQGRTDSYGWTNFSIFLDRGGKILFYHGVSEAWFSAFDTLGFYRRTGEANEGWSDASRYYHVLGMGHCSGGANTYDSFDLLGAVVDLVENGEAPGDVIVSREDPEPASRKLCAYPEHPHYIGGDEASADSFECRYRLARHACPTGRVVEVGTACVPYRTGRARMPCRPLVDMAEKGVYPFPLWRYRAPKTPRIMP